MSCDVLEISSELAACSSDIAAILSAAFPTSSTFFNISATNLSDSFIVLYMLSNFLTESVINSELSFT